MKILILSDLYWEEEAKELSDYLVRTYDHNNPKNSKKYASYLFYRNIINETAPDLVLLGGDITGDGDRHGFHLSLALLLQYLNLRKITTFFIKGNHDIPKFFNYILKKSKKLQYINYIGGQVVNFNKFKILGLDFEDTQNKTRLKEYLSRGTQIDLVLSHCQFSRRAWLFDFNAQYIVTGHYQNHLGFIGNKVFASLGNDIPENVNYITIDLNKNKHSISYYDYNQLEDIVLIQRAVKNGLLFRYTHTPSKLERAKKNNIFSTPSYCNAMNLILKTKALGYHKITEAERKQLEDLLYIHSRIMLTDYLGTTILDKSRWGLREIKILPKELKEQINSLSEKGNY